MRVVLNYLWLSGLVIVSSLGNLAWAQVITEEAEAVETQPEAVGTLPDAVMAAVVTIRGDKGSGTGFVAKFQGNLVIVTNQHVLANNAKLTIVDNQGKNLTGSKFAAASDADIAMIQLDPASPDQAPGSGTPRWA